ncbi:MAG: flavodoxin-dependent (E)-4-hydroxy-3-methylbut-2-enyl-diphosphate synthase [Limnochordia bacterium]
MFTTRDKTRRIKIGPKIIGGGAPVLVQSMTSTDTRDVEKTLEQIRRLAAVGCELVRLAVPDRQAALALGKIKKKSPLPIVADIHFQHTLALLALEQGVDKLRINPGNIGHRDKIWAVVSKAKELGVPIRIGVNAGSLEKDLLAKYGGPTPEALVESAFKHVQILEEMDFQEIVISVKAFSVPVVEAAYRLLAAKCDYPLHLGITEAGTPWAGAIRSAVGLGILLQQGLGDTIRVSLTGDPVEEVKVAYEILKSLELRQRGITLVSCPTCGRCEIDLVRWAQEVEERLAHIDKPLTVAVMGCVVNGPGEAQEADIGIAGGKKGALLFKKGVKVGKLEPHEVVDTLVEEVERMARN